MSRDPFGKRRICRGCGCTEQRACVVMTPAGPQGCAWFALDIETPSGVCSSCGIALRFNPVLIDTVGTDAMDDVSQSIFAHLRCAESWPPQPALLVAE